MNDFNYSLFLLINASAHPNIALVWAAKLLADYTIWLIPLFLAIAWLRGTEQARKIMLEATASGVAGLLVNQAIGLVWQHPRPFMIGMGHTFLPHVADSSFPSDHLTLLWAVAFSFLLHPRSRAAGVVLALLGLPIAWARIYLGVHFPLDMAGAAAVAALSAWVCWRENRWYLERTYRWVIAIYHRLFSTLIRRGWALK